MQHDPYNNVVFGNDWRRGLAGVRSPVAPGVRGDPRSCARFGVARVGGNLSRPSVGHDIIDAEHGQAMSNREGTGLLAAGHGPVGVHQLAQHAGRLQPCQAHQIHGGLGVPSPLQHAALPSLQREHVTGSSQVLGPSPRGTSRRYPLSIRACKAGV